MRWTVLFLPTLLASVYFLVIAADQYESEASFVVRSAVRPELSGSMSFLAQLGLARSQDDSFIVNDFMTSRDAVEQLRAEIPLEAMFDREGADFLARYPSILFGPHRERFYRYYQLMVTVAHNTKSSISTLKVYAFRADDAHDIAATLLTLSEALVNRINQRILTDSIGSSEKELGVAQARLITAHAALTDFRNRELTVDPVRNAVTLADLVAKLAAELGETQAQITEMMSGSAASPQLQGLRRKAAALEEQILRERRRIASGSDDLAGRIAVYERLILDREFANRMVTSSEAELVRSRTEATRQMLYLERVVQPNYSDYPTHPKRLRSILGFFIANTLLVLVGWLLFSGAREHTTKP